MEIQHSEWSRSVGGAAGGGSPVWPSGCGGARFRGVGAKAAMGVWWPPPAVARLWVRVGRRPTSHPTSPPDGPSSAPRVVLTADDRQVWAPAAPERAVVPVLLYEGVAPASGFSQRADADLGIDPKDFARQMALLDQAGYDTITLEEFIRFIKREQVSLPRRPLSELRRRRLDSWTGIDGTLRKLGLNAVLFVDVGRWKRRTLSIRPGGAKPPPAQRPLGSPASVRFRSPSYQDARADDVGPFYAFRGGRRSGLAERRISDITWGEEQLAFRVRRYRPLAFAPPYGNYGQAGTNDQRIPRELLARLLQSFEVVFTQDRSGLASPATNPLGRIKVPRRDRTRAPRAVPGPAALRERLLSYGRGTPAGRGGGGRGGGGGGEGGGGGGEEGGGRRRGRGGGRGGGGGGGRGGRGGGGREGEGGGGGGERKEEGRGGGRGQGAVGGRAGGRIAEDPGRRLGTAPAPSRALESARRQCTPA